MINTPADVQGRANADHRNTDETSTLEVRRDVLTPDLRDRAERQGRDPEEVDPVRDDEDALRRSTLGGGLLE